MFLSLPDEMLIEILDKLTTKDLLTSVLCCHKFKIIINNSYRLLLKLPLTLSDFDENDDITIFEEKAPRKSIDRLLLSERRFNNIVIKLKRENIMSYLSVFKKFGEFISSLKISTYKFDTADQLRMLLRYLPNLKYLKTSNVLFKKSENQILNTIWSVPKLELPQLKNLECVDCSLKLFSVFNNEKIQLRKIRLRNNQDRDYDVLLEFLSHQNHLYYLLLDHFSTDFFSADIKCTIKSQLEVLKLVDCVIIDRDNIRNLLNFIKAQNQLVKIKLFNTPLPHEMYRQIFNDKPKLKEVHLDISHLLYFHSYYSKCVRSVRKLKLNGSYAFENLPIFLNVTRMFPNVTSLKLNSIGEDFVGKINDKYLFQILNTMKNLQHLQLHTFSSRTNDSNFSNLESLDTMLMTLTLNTIDYEVNYIGWKNIMRCMKSIDKLVIKRDFRDQALNEIVDLIISTLKLKHLELGIGVVTADILSNIIYNNNCQELKVLKITINDFIKMNQNFNFHKIFNQNHLLLHLCDDSYFNFMNEQIQ